MTTPAIPLATAADEILRSAVARIAERRRLPESTYRLQFHAGFTFRDATAIVPYLHDLGVTHLYASPYLKARPGSTHGYDVIDHNVLNPEVGTEADYDAWVAAMAERGMGHVLDTVPNHVGVGTNDNAWWNDVLEHGRASRYAGHFDITWDGSPRPELHGKVLIPTLGKLYGDALDAGELKLTFDLASGSFAVDYFDRRFPIDPRTYGRVLTADAADLERALGGGHAELVEFRAIVAASRDLPADPSRATADAATDVKRRLADLVRRNAPAREFVERAVARFNGAPGDRGSFDPLDDLLGRQNYRLAYWRVAPDEINYRRFFDINDLAALAMEREDVFEAAHGFTLRLLADGKIDGLRVDHPDGLYDPRRYFDRLQRHAVLAHATAVAGSDGRFKGFDPQELRSELKRRLADLPELGAGPMKWPLPAWAEKILALDEPFPADWACHGTSGYDALNMVNGLFVDPSAERAFTEVYADVVARPSRLYHNGSPAPTADLHDLIYEKKKLILRISLASELRMLAHRLDGIARVDRHARDFTLTGLTNALREIIACFPVYRSYVTDDAGVPASDVPVIERAINEAVRRNPKTEPAVFRFVRDVLLQKVSAPAGSRGPAEYRAFAGKFQQLTAPATAKGIEDTAFYIYNRLISLNEVGGEPATFGLPPADVHRYFADRQANWPYALSALSTHDTKRSEDVRARINVLSEIPGDWRERVTTWFDLNAPHRTEVAGRAAPDPNEEYLLYQTLVGVWPFDAAADAKDKVVDRVQAYLLKAMREAKVSTSWTDANADHEAAVARFVAAVLDETRSAAFFRDFLPFQRRVSRLGMVNSLAQTLLRLTAPGVPDTYQGTELWDLSLVDPDNRRPVDYARRRELLAEVGSGAAGGDPAAFVAGLLRTAADGRVKLYTTWRGLTCRRDHPGLFSTGGYAPVGTTGERADHLFAFARTSGRSAALVTVPRLTAKLPPADGGWPIGAAAWGDAAVRVPAGLAGRAWRNVFTGATVEAGADGRQIFARDLLATFPVALLMSDGA